MDSSPEATNDPPKSTSSTSLAALWRRRLAILWFYLFLLSVAIPQLHFSMFVLESNLFFQAILLGFWCGVGDSKLWKRLVVFALSYFYFAFCLNEYFYAGGGAALIAVVGLLMVSVAAVAAGWWMFLALFYRNRVWPQFSLYDLLGLMGAIGLVLAIWQAVTIPLLQEIPSYLGIIAGNATFGLGISLIASPTFFRDRQRRGRAFLWATGSLILAVEGFYATLHFMSGEPAGDFAILAFGLAILLLYVTLTLYSAEIALAWWKIRLASPLDGEESSEPACSLEAIETNPLDVEAESPQ